jgi:hypothetical protein
MVHPRNGVICPMFLSDSGFRSHKDFDSGTLLAAVASHRAELAAD